MRPYLLPSFICLFFLLGAVSGSAQPIEWQVGYGREAPQVGYYNHLINPQIEEAAALGPMSFRIHRGHLWLADSVGGRMLVFATDGKLVHALSLPDHPENTLIEDFAFQLNKSGAVTGVWIADGADGVIKLITYPEGREITRFGGSGDEPGLFRQIHQLETDLFGRLYVGDYGKSTITVFNAQGTLEREFPYSRSGFVLDKRGHLSTIEFSPKIGHSWATYGPSGQLISSVHLGLPRCGNPRLWFLEAGGGICVSFIPESGFRGLLHMYRFTATGAQNGRFTLRPPRAMNRFLDSPDGKAFYLALADFERAPKGKFLIRNLSAAR
jgi:hypothetical protein